MSRRNAYNFICRMPKNPVFQYRSCTARISVLQLFTDIRSDSRFREQILSSLRIQKMPDHLAGQEKTRGRGGKSSASHRSHALRQTHRRLRRIDCAYIGNSPALQFLSHHFRQRTDRSLRDICHSKLRRIQLISRPHSADYRNSGCFCALNQKQLGRYRIDGIHHIIIHGKIDLLRTFLIEKQFEFTHVESRIDIEKSSFHDIYLGHTHRAAGATICRLILETLTLSPSMRSIAPIPLRTEPPPRVRPHRRSRRQPPAFSSGAKHLPCRKFAGFCQNDVLYCPSTSAFHSIPLP